MRWAAAGRFQSGEYLDADRQARRVTMAGALTVDNSEAYMGACRAGLGIVQVPRGGQPILPK